MTLYCHYVTTRLENRSVSSVCVNFSKMFISSCGIILVLFTWSIYCVVRADGIVGAGILIVPTLGYGAVILHATFYVTVVSTLVGVFSLKLYAGGVCTTLGGAPSFFKWA